MANPFYENRIEVVDDLNRFYFDQAYRQYNRKFRFEVFMTKGFACVSCGVVGNKVVIWQDNPARWVARDQGCAPAIHVDLAADLPEAKEIGGKLRTDVLMTLDHFIPKACGGHNGIDNLNPMCEPCNLAKGHELPAGATECVRDSGRAASGFPVSQVQAIEKELVPLGPNRDVCRDTGA